MFKCRFCETPLEYTFVDLGMSPLSNAYLSQENLFQMEPFFPLQVYVCHSCFLVQLPEFESPQEIFQDYLYFSSFSDTWQKHVQKYTEQMIQRFGLSRQHQVVEIASNDGCLLKYFKAQGIPVLGIEPAENVAEVAQQAGIPTLVKFFNTQTAGELLAAGQQADLIVANNVLAHVPQLNDFIQAMKIFLKSDGVITIEFPHLLRLMQENQFDTIYHEHFSYFSFTTVNQIFRQHQLILFDVQELPVHGGSLRIFARHAEDKSKPITENVQRLLDFELSSGMTRLDTYASFAEQVQTTKRELLEFMIASKQQGKQIVGYGAPAKGNTLLNYCGIRTDFLDYTVDRSSYKQNHFLPGTHIPIFAPEKIRETRPDYVLILPWNIRQEIIKQMDYIREWGGKFIVPIPKVRLIDDF